MDTLEYCKQHDGPVSAKDIEKLKSLTESKIIAETVFFWRGQLHLTSDWNAKLDEILSKLLQGTLITSDKA